MRPLSAVSPCPFCYNVSTSTCLTCQDSKPPRRVQYDTLEDAQKARQMSLGSNVRVDDPAGKAFIKQVRRTNITDANHSSTQR